MTGSTFDNSANNRYYQEVNPLIRELVEHIKVIFSSGSELMDEDDQFERKKILNRTNFEKETIKLLIGKLNEIWPEGKTIYQEFEVMNQTLSDLIQNAFDWSELINGPDFSVFIPKMKDKNDNYIQNNRELAARSDAHIFKADELLKKSLGLDLMELFNE